MLTTSIVSRVKEAVKNAAKKNKTIGLVPTMGALHDGHISLIKKAKKDCGFVVATIFVNPAQFGPNEDFNKYPRPFKNDEKMLRAAKVDLLFAPSVKTMYASDHSAFVDESLLSLGLCGASRPGHFKGVCTIVAKLFNIVTPDIAYFGQKDYQQVCVIKRMARDLNFSSKIEICPTMREKDGLAKSSRNQYLSPDERVKAIVLSKALFQGQQMIKHGERSPNKIIKKMQSIINIYKEISIDYLELRRAESLEKLTTITGKVVLLGAIRIGSTRLIDNILAKSGKGAI